MNIYNFFLPQFQKLCVYTFDINKKDIIIRVHAHPDRNLMKIEYDPTTGISVTTTLMNRAGDQIEIPILCGHFNQKYDIKLKDVLETYGMYSFILTTSHENILKILTEYVGYIFDGPWDYNGKHHDLDYLSQSYLIVCELRKGEEVSLQKIHKIFNCGLIMPAYQIIKELEGAAQMYPKFIEYLIQATRVCPEMTGPKNSLTKIISRTTLDGNAILKASFIGTKFDPETLAIRGAVLSPLSPYISHKDPQKAFKLLDDYFHDYSRNKFPIDGVLLHAYAMMIYNGVGVKKDEEFAEKINKPTNIPLVKYNTSLLGAIGISFLCGSVAFAGLYLLKKLK